MDIPSLDFAALRCYLRAKESSLESRKRSESPSEYAQEPRSTVYVVLVVALVSSTFSASDLFPAISSTVLGSSKRARILGEGCVPLVAKHGKDLSRLGRESVPPALQSEQRLILVSLLNLWQVFQEANHPFVASTTTTLTPNLAIVLHWLAQANSYSELAAMYAIGKSTVVAIAHEGIAILCDRLVPEAILFPTGRELDQVMVDFEALCGLPCCGGALDGTLMPIKKPADFGDTYFCYKKFTAIIVLAC